MTAVCLLEKPAAAESLGSFAWVVPVRSFRFHGLMRGIHRFLALLLLVHGQLRRQVIGNVQHAAAARAKDRFIARLQAVFHDDKQVTVHLPPLGLLVPPPCSSECTTI